MKPNILFLLIDTFRADKFLGPEKTSMTPNINSLIKNGIYFDQAISCSDGTVLSWSGLFTGLHPFKTGIKSDGYKKINPNITTYFSILKKHGYNFYSYIPSIADSLGIFPKWQNNDHSFDYYWNLSEGLGKKIINLLESKKMDEPTMKMSSKVGPIKIYYGGKTGRGKRIDMEMESRNYIFKLNIRDTQGTDGYPTRMMCDFKTK